MCSLVFLVVIFSYTGNHTIYNTATNYIIVERSIIPFCLREFLTKEEDVNEENKVWHVDSRLNFPGAVIGQLLNFNCYTCLLERTLGGKCQNYCRKVLYHTHLTPDI